PVSERILTESKLEITILLTGEDEADFDDWGRPVKTKLTLEGAVERIGWEDREISWPEKGSVELTGDPGQQAALALSKISVISFKPQSKLQRGRSGIERRARLERSKSPLT
ncbi:hypothetical protein N9134_00370, partial [Akkermansiaceae bacterium]|nr:hypothetical protein [Akkermansiaceae bacterium]